MDFKKREHLLILIVLLCVGALAGDRLVLTPLMKLWSERAKSIDDLQRKVGKGKQLVGRERVLTQRWRAMRDQARTTETSATENDVLNAVNHWALTGALAVTSLKPRWVDEEDCRKFELQVSTSGKLASIVRFLYELETDPQPLKIEELDVDARDNKGQTLTCDVRFTRIALEGGKP